MFDPTVTRQVFNVGASVKAMRRRDKQYRKALRESKTRMGRYVMNKELGLALIEAEEAAEKQEMSLRYRAMAVRLRYLYGIFSKAEVTKTIDEDTKKILNVLDCAVRSMDIQKVEKAVDIYKKYFEDEGDEDVAEPTVDDTLAKGSKDTISQRSKAEEILEEIIRDVSRKGVMPSQPVVITPLAVNLAKKEKPIVEEIIRELEDESAKNPQLDLIASSLFRRSSTYLPDFDL